MDVIPNAQEVQLVKDTLARARAEVGKVIIGQHKVVDHCLIAIFTGNHILLEGVPGVAKTLLVRTLARVLGTDFSRIQFTPDLMPSDITGTNIFNLQEGAFHLVKGPVFTSFLLADEINRAPAKTQSALLQAMQERLVTIDGKTHQLPDSFTVFATQNPIEYEGTYPLPEAQKDRFLLRVEVDYPSDEEEKLLARKWLSEESPEQALMSGAVQPVLNGTEIVTMRKALQALTVKEELVDYVVELVRTSREMDSIEVGAGPRATGALLLSSRALAAIAGRDFVTPDDIRSMAYPVLSHRLVLRPEYEIEGVTVREAIAKLLEGVAVPDKQSAMRFVPNKLLLWLTILLVIPATTMIFFDGGFLRTVGLLVLVVLVLVCLADLQLSKSLLRKLEVNVPEVVRCTKERSFDVPVEFLNKGPTLSWLRYGISTDAAFRMEGNVIRKLGQLQSKKLVRSVIPLVALKRGQFFIELLNVETPSAFSLWLIRREFKINTEIRAYPDLTVERKRLSSLFLMRGMDGAHAVRQVGKGREFEQLREYQSGDDYIDIDWKATGRRRIPVTRTYQIERTQEVYVIVDHSRFSGRQIREPVDEKLEGDWLYREHGAGGEFAVTTQLERFLHCALVLASVAEKQGDLFGFISFADKVDRFIRSRNGKQHYNVIRDALYTLEPAPVAPDFEQLMISLRQRLTRRALLVMLIDLSDPLTAEQFYESLPLVSKQHLILVNMVRPEMAHPLFQGGDEPENISQIYDRLAGHFQWQDLKETGRKLSHLGVELGVPNHEELCTEAVTQYLTVKKRQLL